VKDSGDGTRRAEREVEVLGGVVAPGDGDQAGVLVELEGDEEVFELGEFGGAYPGCAEELAALYFASRR
jgi:hypothetical protein